MRPSELRAAVRSLARSPRFAIVAVASLGIALALNTTMFALVDAILHPPMPHPAPERLFSVQWRGDDPRRVVPPAEKYRAIVSGLSVAQGTAALAIRPAQLVVNGDGRDVVLPSVTEDFFAVIGVPPLEGRTFNAGSAAAREAVISFELWRRGFQERAVSSGMTIEVNEQQFTVVGVMPPGMRFADGAAWIPAGSLPADTSGFAHMGSTVVRVRPGVTKAMLQAELALVARRLQAELGSPAYPLAAVVWDTNRDKPRLDDFHKFLLLVVGGVLAIACANLATLLLARGAARRQEMAVRLAIGASRWTVARTVLLECGAIATAAAALGLLLTQWAMRLVAHWAPANLPQLGDFVPHASWRVFAFALGTALLVMVLAGLLPALRAASVPPAEPLKDGGGSTRRRRERYSGLVVAEVALSTMLLMMAAILVMGNWTLARYEFGFDARRVLSATVQLLPAQRHALTSDASMRLRTELLERLQTTPGVRDVATVREVGPDGAVVMGENGAAGERWMNLRKSKVVSPSYLRTLGIPVVRGRDFAEGDASGGAAVAIIDEGAARRLFPDVSSAVGRMIKLGDRKSDAPWIRVVGLTPELGRRPDTPFWIAEDPGVYVVQPGDWSVPGSLVIASSTRAPVKPLAVRRELRRTLPAMTAVSVEPYTADYDANVRFLGFLALLFSALSAFALVLCAVGLYGVLAYTVSLRTREFAIRLALGARAPAVARLVLHDASVMALAGVGIGAIAALVLTYGMAADLMTLRFAHARALVAAEVVLLAVAAAAAWEPVRRGMRADPSHVMRAN